MRKYSPRGIDISIANGVVYTKWFDGRIHRRSEGRLKGLELVSIFRRGDPGVIPLAVSLLTGEDIEHLVRGEGPHLFGWGSVGAGYNFITGPAEFFARSEDAERATELLIELSTGRCSFAGTGIHG